MTPDVATPKRARRVIAMVKKIAINKSLLIKKLQDKNRRLCKRITNLENMLTHLRKRGFMSEEAGDTLMVSIC